MESISVRFVLLVFLASPLHSLPAPETLEFLRKYGYLEKRGGEGVIADTLYTEQSVSEAVKLAQKFGGLPPTGKLDQSTLKLMTSRRCGLPDVIRPDLPTGKVEDTSRRRRRNRRFVLGSDGWDKRHLTYYLENWPPNLRKEEVIREVSRAMDLWGKYSQLTFTQSRDLASCDIAISFDKCYHSDAYPFDGEGGVLAHAYLPHRFGRLDGDIHFDSDESWKINATEEGVNLHSVVIHELGHSLGLFHSTVSGSVMNPYYESELEDLGYDDILALHKLYISKRSADDEPSSTLRTTTSSISTTTRQLWTTSGIPRRTRPPPTTPLPSTTTSRRYPPSRTEEPPTRGDELGCEGNYECVAFLRTEIFITKGGMLWRFSKRGEVQPRYPIKIRDFFHEFPSTVERIDAIYERPTDYSFVFFIGSQYWVFDGYKFIEDTPRPITDYGLPESIDSVDAVMVSAKDHKTYLFKGDKYWRYDDASKTGELSGKIEEAFVGVPSRLDAVTTLDDGITYFFKGDKYWAFDTEKTSVEPGYPRSASQDWLSC